MFVTSAGTLVYALSAPTSLPMGGYRFSVSVRGNNVTLTPQTQIPGRGPSSTPCETTSPTPQCCYEERRRST